MLKNDGHGTELPSKTIPISFFVDESEVSDESIVTSAAEIDITPPEIIKAVVVIEEYLFSGNPTLIFNARDNGVGILYTEIQIGDGQFVRAESPYNLVGVEKGDEITIRAIDGVGNVAKDIVVYGFEGTNGQVVYKDEVNIKKLTATLIIAITIITFMYFRKRKLCKLGK